MLIAVALAAAQAAPNPPSLFPSRDVSGTAWGPDETSGYGIHRRLHGWDVMLHGNAFGQFIYEPGVIHRTGGFSSKQGNSVNWGMVMARHRAGNGRVGLNVMLSAEPWTVPGCGSLNFFATGEMCDGDTIHDRQHPHDLFMELAATYDRPIGGGAWRWQLYGGLSGEPALGPPGFPHRASAIDNPVAPIAHHWLDSTHISFGVVTTGIYSPRWRLEGSVFDGREPDDRRADLDLGPLDSFSGRVSFLPSRGVALQASAGHLHAAEAEFAPFPRTSIDALTASALVHRRLENGLWATTIAYGLHGGDVPVIGQPTRHRFSSALLLESTVTLHDRHALFGRAELVGKPGHDLHLHDTPARILPVTKLEAGYVRHFTSRHAVTGIGAAASMSVVPRELIPRYYGRIAPGLTVFVVARPPRHVM